MPNNPPFESIPNNKTPLLVVDDDAGLLSSIELTLVSSGMTPPALVSDSRNVLPWVESHAFQLILIDLMMPHMDGMELLSRIKTVAPDIECIIITAVDDVAKAVTAMRLGAFDYIVKPIDKDKLIITVQRALERYSYRKGLTPFEGGCVFDDLRFPEAFSHMIAKDEKMAKVFHLAEIAAISDYHLIITGETGTGKDLLARAIHQASIRSERPFVAVNISSASKTLFEDTFFGHSKGAYTGAVSDQRGFFEKAHKGTLFLDEITELDQALQSKLLRVIEQKEYYRLGSTDKRISDVRIIVATNRDIKAEVNHGHFRKDLFYRLSMFHIQIPPLRKRSKDILPLAHHFLKVHAAKNKKKMTNINRDLSEKLRHYSFPGNVRELENIIAAAVMFETGDTLTLSSVQNPELKKGAGSSAVTELLSLDEVEKQHILSVLDACNNNRTPAAKILNIGVRTLRRKLKRYDHEEMKSDITG